MTDSTAETQQGQTATRRPTSKQGVPRGTLAQAEKMAASLWDAARLGAVSPGAYARQLSGPKAKPSGGAWRSKMALIRVFGLAEDAPNDQIRLSKIGKQIVNTTALAEQAAARRAAVLYVKPYATLLKSSAGTQLPGEASIAGTFEFSYGLPGDAARQAAQHFLSSVRLAGFLDGAETVQLQGNESTVEGDDLSPGPADGGAPNPETEPLAATPDVSGIITPEKLREENPAVTDLGTQGHELVAKGAPSPAVTLALSLDLSQWNVDDALRVLRALGVSAADD